MLGVLLIDLSLRLVKAGIDPLFIKAVCIDLTQAVPQSSQGWIPHQLVEAL